MNAPESCLGEWSDLSVTERVRRVCGLRHRLASDPQPFIDAIKLPFRRSPVETLAAEIIPLADACAFLERNAVRLLRPRRLGLHGRPSWLWGIGSEIHRQPFGRVLIIAPGNYPLMLSGIQTIQALVAGNTVLLKPAPGTRGVAVLLAGALRYCGVPESALTVLEESADAAKSCYGKIDKLILTGSMQSGRVVAHDVAEHLIPTVMELSGCDAAIVLPGADIKLTAACIRFGLQFNGSNSCIAPRRLLVHQSIADELVSQLKPLLAIAGPLTISPELACRVRSLGKEAIQAGATLICGHWPENGMMAPLLIDHAKPDMQLQREDVGAPIASIVRVSNTADVHAANAKCPFRLGASIFGPPAAARELAHDLKVGTIVINDLMAPTADPRLPFGGAGASGFGSTRGAEGLLEMTRPKTVQIVGGSPRFHLQMDKPSTEALVRAQLQMSHAKGWPRRLGGLRKLVSIGYAASKGVKA
jgi:acyl-CoA reductase-like NAD-dependent aldehyde dehydrogenase